MHSAFSQSRHIRTLQYATVMLVSLACCGVVSCSRSKIEQLDQAAQDGNLAKVKILLKDNPNLIFSKNENGDTPLFLATAYSHADIVEFLLSKNVDVNVRNNYGMTPLHGVLTHYQEDLTDLHVAELLVAKGADVNATNYDGETPLDFAAHDDSAMEIAKLLLANKANVNGGGSVGWTPLHITAFYGQTNMAKLLLTSGAKVNAKADDGRTPLHIAAQNDYKDMVELLLTNGADVNAEANNGWTPLHEAKKNDFKDVVELLRQHGGHE